MARIGENAFRQYRDGQDRLTAREYTAERELIRLAVNDLDDKVQRTEGIREEFSNTVNEVENVKGEIVQTKQEVETRIGEFSQTVEQATQELENKASKEDVSQISTQLENKASKTEVQEVSAQLAENVKDVDDIVISVKKIGIVANDRSKARQNTALLNEFLANNIKTDILFLSKDYYFDNLITVTGTNRLIGKVATRLWLTNTETDFILINPFGGLEKVKIMLPNNHLGAGIVLKNNDYTQWGSSSHFHYIRDVFIRGEVSNPTSTGIYLEALEGFNISNFSAYNVTISNCSVGVKVIGNEFIEGNGWANGIFFDNLYTQNCDIGIYNTGAGNRFIYSHQFSDGNHLAVHCEGHDNMFIGMIWDARPGQKHAYLSPGSESNFFIGRQFSPNVKQNFVTDLGSNNFFYGSKDQSYPIPNEYRYDTNDNLLNPSWTDFYGAYSNVLYHADKIGTVSFNVGSSSIVSGDANSLLNGEGMRVNNPSVNNPFIIEISLPGAIDYSCELGITFRNGCHPRYIKVEYQLSGSSTYTTAKEITDNLNGKVSHHISPTGRSIVKIRISVANAIYNATANPNERIWIGGIYLFSKSKLGTYYLPASGGDIYGDLKFSNSKSIVVTTPDGMKKYRIGVDNNGNLITTLV